MEDTMNKDMVVFDITDTAIAELSSRYMGLTIKGIDDKPGLDAVHRARMDIKSRRVSVQKDGKVYREKANIYLKKVLTEEKRVLALLEPIEDHLSDEESRIVEEIARIKAEADAKAKAHIEERSTTLFKMGCQLLDGKTFSYSGVDVAEKIKVESATDEQFDALVQELQAILDEEAAEKAKAEQQRLDEQTIMLKVQQEQETERQRLEAEQARINTEQEAAKMELAAAQVKLKAQQEELAAAKQKLIDDEAARVAAAEQEKKRIEDEKQRVADLAKAKEEEKLKARQETLDVLARQEGELGSTHAAVEADLLILSDEKWYAMCDARRENIRVLLEENAKRETEARLKKEAEEKAAKEAEITATKLAKAEAARVRAERKAARQPDKIKILAWITSFNEQNNAIDPLKTEEAKKVYADALAKLEIVLQEAKEAAEEL